MSRVFVLVRAGGAEAAGWPFLGGSWCGYGWISDATHGKIGVWGSMEGFFEGQGDQGRGFWGLLGMRTIKEMGPACL